jgi:2-oxoglutarate dehydrogenase complex dehydrogenase (E1) component-like enzyme
MIQFIVNISVLNTCTSEPEIVQWIQDKLTVNDNQPSFSVEKKTILFKLNEVKFL